MRKIISACLAGSLWAATVHAQPTTLDDSARRVDEALSRLSESVTDGSLSNWRNCIDATSVQFSKASDTADLVADAVVQKCDHILMDYVNQASPTASSGAKLQVMDSLRKSMRNRALMNVIETRSRTTR